MISAAVIKSSNNEIYLKAIADLKSQTERAIVSSNDRDGVIEAAKRQFGLKITDEAASIIWSAFRGDKSPSNKRRYGEAVADLGHYGSKEWLRTIR